jgi:hypothetical protein
VRLKGVVFGLVCALWILITPLALILAGLSPMAGEQGGAGRVAPMALLFTWPAATILAPIAGAISWRKGRRKLACGLVASPLLWVAALFVIGSPFDAR